MHPVGFLIMKAILRFGSRIVELSQVDFCPQFNRYVYWLKQPVGWFVVALGASILVGAFVSPLGWALAVSLASIIGFGLAFPWIAVYGTRLKLKPVHASVHEQDAAEIEVEVQNRLPLPLMGLMINRYTTTPADEEIEIGEVGLAHVPLLSVTKFRFKIHPEYRGQYPTEAPEVSCAFPFGIWKAKRKLLSVEPIMVKPLVVETAGMIEFSGKRLADTGDGERASTTGEFMGLREFRNGDSLKTIHWAQTAKLDSLVVCERGGPQHQPLVVQINTGRSEGSKLEARENLAWRVRIAAGLIGLFGGQKQPLQLKIDDQLIHLPAGADMVPIAWNHLAQIPLDGGIPSSIIDASQAPTLCIDSQASREPGPPHLVHVSMHSVNSESIRHSALDCSYEVDLRHDIGHQVNQFLLKLGRAKNVA